jgi:hypothetical protein
MFCFLKNCKKNIADLWDSLERMKSRNNDLASDWIKAEDKVMKYDRFFAARYILNKIPKAECPRDVHSKCKHFDDPEYAVKPDEKKEEKPTPTAPKKEAANKPNSCSEVNECKEKEVKPLSSSDNQSLSKGPDSQADTSTTPKSTQS